MKRTYTPWQDWKQPSKQTEYTAPTALLAQDGTKYQLWAVQVSLRARKRAARSAARAAHDDPYGRTSVSADVRDSAARTASADQTVRDLRDLAESAGGTTPEGQAAVSVPAYPPEIFTVV